MSGTITILLMIYRIMYNTNAMNADTDYIEMAQLLGDAGAAGRGGRGSGQGHERRADQGRAEGAHDAPAERR